VPSADWHPLRNEPQTKDREKSMAKTTLLFAGLLVLLGVGGYGAASAGVLGAKASITALIPAFVGVVLGLFGALALKDSLRKHAMHGAAMIGLLGCLAGAGRGLPGLPALLSGSSEKPLAVILTLAMAVICGLFVALCVKSFIAARRARQAGNTAADTAS
jgi:FtsH-binding integral membrane protein